MKSDICKLVEKAAQRAMEETTKREVMPAIEAEIKRRVRARAKAWLAENSDYIDTTVDKLIQRQLKDAAAKAVKQAARDVKVTTSATRKRYSY